MPTQASSSDSCMTDFPDPSPAALGYRMPAEWEPHDATWFSWPHNPDTWPRQLEATEAILAEAVRSLCEGETVHVNVLDEEHEDHVRSLIGETSPFPTRFHHIPTNDAWCRDHGAIFVRRDGPEPRRAALNWKFNAWGGKYPPFDLDDAVASRMAEVLGVPRFDGDIILEGGGIEVNGAGMLLTTTTCLLNPNRNPGLSRDAAEFRLRSMFGVDRILWLEGDLAGDDTDGHIDNLVRFVSRDTVVAAVEPDPTDVNYQPLQENLRRLALDAPDLQVIEVAMPEPVFTDGVRLPASYVNFLIANGRVLLPVYGSTRDHQAEELLSTCFPDRRIVSLDCRDVVWGLGAFHCLTQQVPAV